MANSLKILIILLIGGIGVQTTYAKKDKNAVAKDSVAVIAEIEKEIKEALKKEPKKESKKVAKKDTAATVKAAEKEETIIKVDGLLEVGFDNHYRYKPYKNDRVTHNRIGKAEVGISFRPVKKVRAEMGFEYDRSDSVTIKIERQIVTQDSRYGTISIDEIEERRHIERPFTMDKLYIQYNPLNFNAIRFGYMKKSFGIEERTGLDERYFRKRSVINDFLDSSGTGFLGHDLTLQYRHELGKKFELRGGFSWTEDSTRYLQNYSVEYNDKKNNLILAAIIKHYLPPDEDMITTYISSLSYKRTNKLFASEAELTYGTNPVMKRSGIDATILGARIKENFFINTGTSILNQVIPVTEAAIFSRDFKKDSAEFDAQLRAGLTLGFAKKSAFQWRNNYGTIYKIKEDNKYLWRRRFDTEVVVVF